VNFPTLTLAIPTYNRRPKLQRLLSQVTEQTERLAGFPRLQVLVSNNCSTDGTREFLDNFKARGFDLRIIHQPANVGACRNQERLHRESVTDYTWVFSDDDLLLADAIAQVWSALRDYAPDVLRFSFAQPLMPAFTFSQPVYVAKDLKEIACLIAHSWKISSYVHKNVVLPPNEPIFHYAYGYCWIWLGWAYAVVSANPNPKLCVISRPLASCDEDETDDGTRFGRTVWAQMPHVFRHPFVLENAPHLYHNCRDWVYKNWIRAAFKVRLGQTPKEFFDYKHEGVRPPLRFSSLLRSGRLEFFDRAHEDTPPPPYRFGSLLRTGRVICRWVCLRINSPIAFRLCSHLETAATAIAKRRPAVRRFLKGP
jgi:glycosyltransferase involved in cell wall biosynthesis